MRLLLLRQATTNSNTTSVAAETESSLSLRIGGDAKREGTRKRDGGGERGGALLQITRLLESRQRHDWLVFSLCKGENKAEAEAAAMADMIEFQRSNRQQN